MTIPLICILKQYTDLDFCVRALLDNGSRVNATEHFGGTALLMAAGRGHLKIVEVSLWVKIVPKYTHKKFLRGLLVSPNVVVFLTSILRECTDLDFWIKVLLANWVNKLLDHGDSVNTTNGQGKTPSAPAACFGYSGITRVSSWEEKNLLLIAGYVSACFLLIVVVLFCDRIQKMHRFSFPCQGTAGKWSRNQCSK